MTKALMILFTAGSLALAGCADMTRSERTATGALAGGAVGLAAGDAITGDGTGRVIGALAGAAAGAAIAADSVKQCRYPDGHIADCPPGY